MISKRFTRSSASSGSAQPEEITILDDNDVQASTCYGIEDEDEESDGFDDDTSDSTSVSGSVSPSLSVTPPLSPSVSSVPVSATSETPLRKRGRPRKTETHRKTDDFGLCSDPEACCSSKATKVRSKIHRKGVEGKMHGGRPAELFRTDFITAMKVNENETFLDVSRCFIISDPWRQEWNNGVQVPVNPISLREIDFLTFTDDSVPSDEKGANKKNIIFNPKYRRVTKDGFFDSEKHHFVAALKKAGDTCRYDLDDSDVRWLTNFNLELAKLKAGVLSEEAMEKVIECLEVVCYENIRRATLDAGIRTEKQQREDDASCDVCFNADSELDDQIVFCDRCDMAVHQSCYGTGPLPEGTWICRSCRICPTTRQKCILCPNRGGALKCTRSGEKWAHVSCVWWIPEVRFENPETMEPVIHIAKIPADRWNLKCVLCRKIEGACIQCSEKTCPVAYHVTCAQRHGLYMQMNPNKLEGDLKLLSYCPKHHRNNQGNPAQYIQKSPTRSRLEVVSWSPSNKSHVEKRFEPSSPASPRKLDQKKREDLEEKFHEFVNPDVAAKALKDPVPTSILRAVFEYWKLKRQRNGNKSLLTPKEEEDKLLKEHEEKEYTRLIKMLITLRQNLEKARNLCYMVVRSRKQELQYRKVFEEQFDLLAEAADRTEISKRDIQTLYKYLEPVPGSLGIFERKLRGLSPGQDCLLEGTPKSDPSAAPSPRTSEEWNPMQMQECVGIPAEKSPSVECIDLDSSKDSIEILADDKKRNGLYNGFVSVVSPKTTEELELMSERDRNFNLSPAPVRKAEAAPKNIAWDGELNGLISATGNRKRKAASPVGRENDLWDSSGDKGNFYQVSESKRVRLMADYSSKLRSKRRSEPMK